MPSRTSFSSVDRFGRNQTSHFVSKQKRKSLGFSIGPGDYGNSIISDGSGNLEWSGSIAAKQKDIYLTKEPIVIPTTDVFQEFSFPLYRDGSFQFANQNQIVHVKICLYYKYKNSTSHLPFYIQIKKNGEEVYLNGYGDYDKVGDLNKLSDHLSIEANFLLFFACASQILSVVLLIMQLIMQLVLLSLLLYVLCSEFKQTADALPLSYISLVLLD